ncbi:amidohydrolase family protein [Parapedobacter lycopersici]|uniref:amidohydrolase family protein n=1 Tax=Parapedobacter lycopersici TaxID=1864939 RepID=UPI00214D6948|nr:amidohydrolase family protein [Parapedobacter lycopersici]
MKLNRRNFLGTGGLALLGASLSGVSCSEPSGASAGNAAGTFQPEGWKKLLQEANKYPKLDAHNHIWEGSNADQINESCELLGITRAACSIPGGKTPEAIRANNDAIIKGMKAYPQRIMGQCYIDPRFKKEALEEIDRCVDQGMVMLGELYDSVRISDPLYYPIVERCIKHRIPMMLHGVTTLGNWRPGYLPTNPPNSSLPDDFVEIGNRYPEAMIICGHIGGGGNWEYMCRVLQHAPSVFLDTSGSVSDEGMIDMAVQYLGVDRLLFATDMNYETGVGKIMWANLTESDRKKVFFENFNNLLRKAGNHVN